MKRSALSPIAVALAGLVLAGSAAAQQTPATAQAFLKAVSEAQQVLLTDLASESLPTQRIATVESAGCASRFIVRQAEQLRGIWALNWREVRTSRLEGDRQVRLTGPAVNWLLSLESPEIAGRVLNAVTVVRRSCDPTQGFGF